MPYTIRRLNAEAEPIGDPQVISRDTSIPGLVDGSKIRCNPKVIVVGEPPDQRRLDQLKVVFKSPEHQIGGYTHFSEPWKEDGDEKHITLKRPKWSIDLYPVEKGKLVRRGGGLRIAFEANS
jgi:hypothetical protein